MLSQELTTSSSTPKPKKKVPEKNFLLNFKIKENTKEEQRKAKGLKEPPPAQVDPLKFEHNLKVRKALDDILIQPSLQDIVNKAKETGGIDSNVTVEQILTDMATSDELNVTSPHNSKEIFERRLREFFKTKRELEASLLKQQNNNKSPKRNPKKE